MARIIRIQGRHVMMCDGFDPLSLYEDREPLSPFGDSLGEVLEAVKAGRKGMEMISSLERWGPSELAYYHEEIEPLAFDLELPVTLQNTRHSKPLWPEDKELVTTFAHTLEQSWRMPAFDALRQVLCGRHLWSIVGEHLFSLFLGYEDCQIAEWLASREEGHASYGARTVSLLVPQNEYDILAPLGFRAFARSSELSTIAAHTPGMFRQLKPDAHSLVPDGLVLCRIAINSWLFREVVDGEDKDDDGTWIGHFSCDVPKLNASLRCGIERRLPTGWDRQVPDL